MPGPTRPLPITEPRKLAAALKRLDERERRVLELRYGLRGERQHMLAEVGRLLGVSRERARQLETKALARLGTQGGAPPTRHQPVEHPAFLKSFVRPGTLFSLQSGPAHGYELRKRLRARGFGELDYRFLRTLEGEGVVRSSWEKGGGDGPERRVYRLTSKGIRQLREDADAIGQVVAALARFIGDYHEVAARLGPADEETRAGSARPGASGDGMRRGATPQRG
ncbi:MAG: helix-turn-helix transcriptional regulator [Actinomycetota bacterium]|nr:helix-turn-helix transcriptional regulator [Actinomycetota bacterium]